MELCQLGVQSVVLRVVVLLVAKSNVAVPAAAVVIAVELAVCIVEAAVVLCVLCRHLFLLLLREGSLVAAGTASGVLVVLCLCRCSGLCHCGGAAVLLPLP